MANQKKPSGYVFYRGPSMIDGQPIVGVAITKKSTNSKTGDIIQTYILVDNGLMPVENTKQLLDVSVCGDCKHRRGLGGACYVNQGQGPRAVYDGVLRGIYPTSIREAKIACAGRIVRLGAYGDPAAIPAYVWGELLEFSSDHTGYSHQWKNPDFHGVMQWCMASADSDAERNEAKILGYRTFRVRHISEPIQAGEFVCPASHEAGRKKTCADCTACDGGINTRKADPVIIAHGSLAKRFIPIKAI